MPHLHEQPYCLHEQGSCIHERLFFFQQGPVEDWNCRQGKRYVTNKAQITFLLNTNRTSCFCLLAGVLAALLMDGASASAEPVTVTSEYARRHYTT